MYQAALRGLGLPHSFKGEGAWSRREFSDVLSDPSFDGVAIDYGFKVAAISHIQYLSTHARNIGAVNTVIPTQGDWSGNDVSKLDLQLNKAFIGPKKGLFGENTDWIGIYRCIEQRISSAHAITPKTTAVVIGADGTSRAAIYALIQLKVPNIFVYRPGDPKAHTIANHFNSLDMNSAARPDNMHQAKRQRTQAYQIHVIESPDDKWPTWLSPPTFVVSCLPSHGASIRQSPQFQLPSSWLTSPTGGIIVETSYEPLIDPVKDWMTVSGLQLLPERAAPQFELLTGRRSPRTRMALAVWKHHEAEKLRLKPQ
ncbi:hypothetical protein N7456_000437 [Penicillium angulare]|uniref:Shikimate dehydrogenase substrate binding N-terminal domain-containing protein n=1 Tax=Penicillium angulare TaxID=116970 RepID=A0A9W9KS79_9EURO|nr:hypothetical protein N7456_000437 [Penicillium angulare]